MGKIKNSFMTRFVEALVNPATLKHCKTHFLPCRVDVDLCFREFWVLKMKHLSVKSLTGILFPSDEIRVISF